MPTLPAGFSVDNEISLFEIMDIPMTDKGYTTFDQMGAKRSAMTVNPSKVVKAEIEAYLNDATECPPQKITRLVSYIALWDGMTTKTSRIVNGNVGDLSNVTQDYAETRDMIRQRVRILVPFYDRYTLLKKLAEGPENNHLSNNAGHSVMILH